jgi:hypothetical protein
VQTIILERKQELVHKLVSSTSLEFETPRLRLDEEMLEKSLNIYENS